MDARDELTLQVAKARSVDAIRRAILEARAAGVDDAEIGKALGSSLTAFSEAYSVIWNQPDLRSMHLKAQKAATATRDRFKRDRRNIPAAVQRKVMARFEAGGRVCAICRQRIEEGDQVDIHHLTSWRFLHLRNENPDTLENLAVAHRACNQGWKLTTDEHAQLRTRFERYLATQPVEKAQKLRRSLPRTFRGHRLGEFLDAKGF